MNINKKENKVPENHNNILKVTDCGDSEKEEYDILIKSMILDYINTL